MRHKPVPGFVMFTQEGKPLWLKPADIRAIRPKGGGHPGSILDTYGGDLIRLVDQPPLIAMRRLKKALEEAPSPAVPGQDDRATKALESLRFSMRTANTLREANIELHGNNPVSDVYLWASRNFEEIIAILKEGKGNKE